MKLTIKVAKNKWTRRILRILAVLFVLLIVLLVATNLTMVARTQDKIIAVDNSRVTFIGEEQLEQLKEIEAECIIVPGASVYPNGNPSPMLKQRLDTAVKFYMNGVAAKILLSGDNGTVDYNELRVMAKYCQRNNVPTEDIFCDYAGFSSYDTMYRAKAIFQVDRAVIVTQKYHLYRMVYGCQQVNIEARGVASDQQVYGGQIVRDAREVLARSKDIIKWAYHPEPKFLGDTIPISGPGNCKF